jgi:DnaK suppressor protein
MSPLTPAQLSELKDELERQLEKLQRSMQVTAEAVAPVELDQTAVGRLSRMDSLQSQGLSRSLQEREEMKLILLRDALVRLEGGRYGLCMTCGGEIPFERLYVFPEAPSCSSCADFS